MFYHTTPTLDYLIDNNIDLSRNVERLTRTGNTGCKEHPVTILKHKIEGCGTSDMKMSYKCGVFKFSQNGYECSKLSGDDSGDVVCIEPRRSTARYSLFLKYKI